MVKEKDINNAEVRMNHAIEIMEQGNLEKAIEEFEKARTLDPLDHLIAYNLGFAYSRMNKLEEAIGAYQDALKLDTKKELSSIIHMNLAGIYRKIKDYNTVLINLEEAINNAPHQKNMSQNSLVSQAYVNMEMIYTEQTMNAGSMEFTKSDECLRKAQEIFPQNPDIQKRFSFIEKTKMYGYTVPGEEGTIKKYVPGDEEHDYR